MKESYEEVKLIEGYETRWIFGTHEKCDGTFLNGNKCTRNAKVYSTVGNFCNSHLPESVRLLVEESSARKEHEFDVWQSSVENKIKALYQELSLYRKVPPPEAAAYLLLSELQGGRCFMCWVTDDTFKSNDHLVEDHCHSTGMVRALLCRSCNILESKSPNRMWETYRKFAPANGWYYRYFGYGQQWNEWDDDPLHTRVTMKDVGFEGDSFRECYRNKTLLENYQKAASSLPQTKITFECQQRFDLVGRPIPLVPNKKTNKAFKSDS